MFKRFFHGSYDRIPLGTVMSGRGVEYQNDWSGLGETHALIERFRPPHQPGHSQAVFMVSSDDDGNNTMGLDDIDILGGGTDFILELRPLGPVTRHDVGHLQEIRMALADTTYEDLSFEQQQGIQKSINAYWNGTSNENEAPLWEYIAEKAVVVGRHDFETWKPHRFEPFPWMSGNDVKEIIFSKPSGLSKIPVSLVQDETVIHLATESLHCSLSVRLGADGKPEKLHETGLSEDIAILQEVLDRRWNECSPESEQTHRSSPEFAP